MILYHYTSLSHFLGIWKDKKMYFSPAINTNDFFERFKTFTLTQNTFKCGGVRLDKTRFDHFDEKIWSELRKYRQVSFSCDYDEGIKGYASPMMWGHYAWRKIGENSWQNGVCIALDSDKIKVPPYVYQPGKVLYSPTLESPKVENIDYTKEDAAALFVERNIKTYFFTKHKHWEHENEYRYISKQEGFLDIGEAIIGVYALNDIFTPLEDIRTIVKDDSLIYKISLRVDNLDYEPYTQKEVDDLQEMMRTFVW